MIVVDASVLVELLLGRSEAIDLVATSLSGDADEALHAPDLIEPEALNALRGLRRGDVINDERAEIALAALDDIRLIRYPHAPLRARVWELRDSLSAYDALYLALADTWSDSQLLTGDAPLTSIAARILGEDRVRHLDV